MIAKGSLEVKLRTVWTDGKAEMGRVREEKEQKREDQRRGRVRRKKMQAHEKIAKSRNTVFFQWFVAPEGRRVGSLKRRVRSHVARWEMKSCTPWWREAHFQVKMYKAHQGRSTFGSWDVQKVHTVAARSTCPSQNVQSTALLEVEMSKKCTQCWRETHSQVKMYKAHQCRSTFGSWDVQKVHTVVARSTFRSQNFQKLRGSGHFWTFRCRFAWQAQGIVHLVKSEQTWGFCSISKNDGRRGTFAEDLRRCISRGRRRTTDIFIRDVRRSGRWFPEKGCILEHQIFSFGEMILRGRCSTSYDLAPFFVASAVISAGGVEKSQNALVRGRQLTLHSTFYFWRKPRRIASFLMLSTSKIEEVSQNCFVFGAIKFRNWGSLAE